MAALTCSPVSPEAAVLIEHLILAIHAEENRSGTRQRARRADDLEGFYTAVGALVADLLIARSNERSGGLVYRSLNANSFSGGPVAFRQFTATVRSLEALGLIERFDGYYAVEKIEWSPGVVSRIPRGRASRFRATTQLLDLADQLGVVPFEARKHFHQPRSERLVALKARSRRNGRDKIAGEPMPLPDAPEVDRIREQVRAINAFLEQVEIRGGEHLGFYRGFEHGDQPGFHWNKGGRLYSEGTYSYQHLKKADRLRMTLNGEPVVEIDIKSSYLTILHGRAGVALDLSADPYTLADVPRKVVKVWLVATLGNDKHLTRWPAGHAREYQERTGRILREDHLIAAVRAGMTAKYPVLTDLRALDTTWADLMFIESEVIISTMLKLIEQEIPSLPVHDSLIVPASAEGIASSLLKQSFQEGVGIEPMLEVSHSE
jgi:hypothetical protein